MTCKEALRAHYSVEGISLQDGISQYAPYLRFHEAQRYFAYLVQRGMETRVVATLDGQKFYSHD
tara:strand:- start:328 stop:519 length:192 start_codon:yes stop_codon:yes gene_type:complete